MLRARMSSKHWGTKQRGQIVAKTCDKQMDKECEEKDSELAKVLCR
jgi:hypothetical protein